MASIPSSTLEKFSTFGDLLRYLRRAAGLTQLELSVQVGYSHAQISRLEQNLRLPDIPTIEARFVPALGVENEPGVVARLLELAANIRREDAPGLGLCPYKGLNYFDESDADVFVGREALTTRLMERLISLTKNGLQPAARFLAVIGASGSGKSSLVRAGLIPALRWNKVTSDWQIHTLTPTVHPLESLAVCLTSDSVSVTATTTLMDDLSCDPRSLQLFVKRQWPDGNRTFTLLVIDQFEELFALCRSEEEKTSFIGNLLTAASEADGPVVVLITLRADFYAFCANYVHLREALAYNQEYIGAMNEEELRRAIEEPARRGRWELEPGLIDLLLHDVGNEPGALPLLSHALFETWQRRRGRTMTLSGYASSGGVRGAIAETAETVFTDQLSLEQRSIARRIFLRLTELGGETSAADTRRRAKFNELILKPEEAVTTRAVLKALADARLIITTEDSAEVAHEALIREWPTLRGWLEENREGLRLHRQLTEAAQEWQQADRSTDILYRGARLAQVREWALSHQAEMNELECDFLAASVKLNEHEAAEREAQRQRELDAAQRLVESEKQRANVEKQRAEEQTRSAQQLRKRSNYLAAAFFLALLMAVAAIYLGRQALTSSRLATSRELAAASIANLELDPERSILLALEALESGYTVEAEDALHQAVQVSRIERVVQAHEPGTPMMAALSPDGRQFLTASSNGTVKTWDLATGEELLRFDGYFAAYSPDGKRLAIVVSNGTVQIIDLATGHQEQLSGQIDAALTVSFHPDGTRLATVTAKNLPKVWDVETGRELAAFPGHSDYVSSAVFSPTGEHLLTASDDLTARVWDTAMGEQLLSFPNHPAWVVSARYSPDGKLIATLSGNSAYIWNESSGELVRMLTGHKSPVYTVAFSPDGTLLATSGADRKIIVWDVVTGKELFRLAGHQDEVVDLSFSRDGEHLLSSSRDGTARIWNVRPSRELLTIPVQESSGQIAFNRDGTLIAVADRTGTIKIWDTRTGSDLIALSSQGSRVNDIAFDKESKRLIVGGEDGKFRVWDVVTGTEQAVVAAHSSIVSGISVLADGTRLATASHDYKVKVWDLSSGKISDAPLLTLDHSGRVFSVAYSPVDGKLAVGVQEGNIALWDDTGKEIGILRGHEELVSALAFSPDGEYLATASWDGTAKVWEVATRLEKFSLQGHSGEVTSVAYSPDGKQIVTTSQDSTAKLWDAFTGEELLTFPGDGSPLSDVLFSPDGDLLATGGDRGARIYLVQIEDLIALAKTRVTRSFTPEECRKYLHRDTTACAPATTLPTTTPMPPTDQGRVCQVTNTAGLYDNSFNEIIYQGLQDSHTRFGWDVKVLQSAATSDFEKNIREFLRGDCDLIVGLFSMADALRAAAESNPHQKFLIEYPYDSPLENVWMQSYATDQAAFLAGYTAAAMTKTGKVGVFGGIEIPQVTVFMNGFVLGVEYYNQKNNAVVSVIGWNIREQEGLFVGDFCCAAEGRQITQQILDQGADIILPVAGSDIAPGVTYAVRNHKNAFVIGVDTDWAVTNPEYSDIVLTSIIKNLDMSVVRAVEAIEQGTFTGGIHIGTLETDEVRLAPFYTFDSLISPSVKADLEQIRKDIILGKIKTLP